MMEKMGRTLDNTGDYEITIIGFAPSAASVPSLGNLKTISLGHFHRLSVQRWLAKWRVLRHAYTANPAVFIFNTYELLLPAIVLKVFRNTRIVYDVRENYYRNILHSEGLPALARLPLALGVRLLEKLTAPAVDHFFLAEKGYEHEFKFHRGGWTVIENKAVWVEGRQKPDRDSGLKLLFTGTLSESSGVFRAIKLAQLCHAERNDVSLIIAGYAAAPAVQARIKSLAATRPFITLIGIDTLVPHTKILELIQTSDAGIIANPNVSHTENCVPTKLFEYLQASLPIITEERWPWVKRFAAYDPFVFCDFESPAASTILNALTSNTFYTTPVRDAGWESEEPALLKAIKNMV